MSAGDFFDQPYRVYDIDLTTAQARFEIPEDASGMRFISADDATQEINVRFNDSSANPVPISVGGGVKHYEIKTVYLDWEANPGKIARLAFVGSSFDVDPTKMEVYPSNPVSNVEIVNDGDNPVIIGKGLTDVQNALPAGATIWEKTGTGNFSTYQVPGGKKLIVTDFVAGSATANECGHVAAQTSLFDQYLRKPWGVANPIQPYWVIPAGHYFGIYVTSGNDVDYRADGYLVDA